MDAFDEEFRLQDEAEASNLANKKEGAAHFSSDSTFFSCAFSQSAQTGNDQVTT